MPASISTSPVSAVAAGVSSDQKGSIGNNPGADTGTMGKRKVTPHSVRHQTRKLAAAGLSHISLKERTVSSVSAPVGLSLIDQSNLSTLAKMNPLLICQGILSIEGSDELDALNQLLKNTHHRDNTQISQIISRQQAQLQTRESDRE